MGENDKPPVAGQKAPLWKSTSLLIALVLTGIGLFLWHPWSSEPAAPKTSPNLPPGVSSFSQSPDADTTAQTPASSASPALFRFGASYIAGFFLGWFCRKSLKMGLLLAGAAVIVLFYLQHTGRINVDWPTIQAHLSQSLAWLRGELGALKDFVLGYLPSTAAGVVGIFMGLRRG